MVIGTILAAAVAQAEPSFSVERGVYDDAFALDISPSEEDAVVYASIDGRSPTSAYAGPIEVSGTAVVRAFEERADGTRSGVVTHTYVFPGDVERSPVMNPAVMDVRAYRDAVDRTLRGLPTMSLVTEAGLGFDEVAASWEWIDPTGEDVQVNCGSRRVGGASVIYEKNSIRLVFRERYGAKKLELDLYGDDYRGVAPATEHDALTLRSGNHDSQFYLAERGQHLRNFWMDETQLAQGHVAPHGRFANLYLDGEYVGLYHVRERFNAAYLAHYLGGSEDDYEAVNGGYAFDGSGAAWNALVSWSSRYEEAQRWLDVPNFLDYMVLNYYAANAWDWSYNHNWIAAGPTRPDQGGFRFHSSDSDICLYYDVNTNILGLGGPSNVFSSLTAEGDPDFRSAFIDATWRNVKPGGPLDPVETAERYSMLAAMIDDAVVAESARWGAGWWDRDGEWVTERDNLLANFFPRRTEVLVEQFRAAGWFGMDGPALDPPPGVVSPGTVVTAYAPGDEDVVLAAGGQDPRLPGGEIAPSAVQSPRRASITLAHSAVVLARPLDGDTWGPVDGGFYEVDEDPPLALNEWNAVDEDASPEGPDLALGSLLGNGGDWFELVVLQDLDLRGWTLALEDAGGARGTITFTQEPVLAELRAGTILTVAEELPEDVAYDPAGGDWKLHLRATADGAYARADGFDVTHASWRMTAYDPDGWVRFGPAGEGVSPTEGVGSGESGAYQGDPARAWRRDDAAYGDASSSSYGYPNRWGDREQEFSALRGQAGSVLQPGDTGAGPGGSTGTAALSEAPGECACGGGGGAGLGWLVVAAAVFARRRLALAGALGGCAGTGGISPTGTAAEEPSAECFADRDRDGSGDASAPIPCGGAAVNNGDDCDDADALRAPDLPEVCNGLDDDCDGTVDGPDVVDGLPMYADRDGDGYGDPAATVTACAAGAGVAAVGGDCDDGDSSIHPGAAEKCDDVDDDCDGVAEDALGLDAACPAESCAAIARAGGELANGVYWIELTGGRQGQVACELETNGGGWTLGMVRNSASVSNVGNWGGSEEAIEGLGMTPGESSASTTPVMSWLDLSALQWDELWVAAYSGGSLSYASRVIERRQMRIEPWQDGYFLYGGDTGYYWCGGQAAYTDSEIGATNNPEGAPRDCKGHGSLGSGWDFSESPYANAGLTMCGADGSYFMAASWGGSWTYYGTAGAAQAVWVR